MLPAQDTNCVCVTDALLRICEYIIGARGNELVMNSDCFTNNFHSHSLLRFSTSERLDLYRTRQILKINFELESESFGLHK